MLKGVYKSEINYQTAEQGGPGVLGRQGQVVELAAVQDGVQAAAAAGAVTLGHVAVRANSLHPCSHETRPVSLLHSIPAPTPWGAQGAAMWPTKDRSQITKSETQS